MYWDNPMHQDFHFRKGIYICASNNQIREISLLYFHLMSHHVMHTFFSNVHWVSFLKFYYNSIPWKSTYLPLGSWHQTPFLQNSFSKYELKSGITFNTLYVVWSLTSAWENKMKYHILALKMNFKNHWKENA